MTLPLHHISLEVLQGLPDGEEFFATFSPTSVAHRYEMVDELRKHVNHRAHEVHGAWQGDRGCTGSHNFEGGAFKLSANEICPNCHHRAGNHPECELFSWITVLCGGQHVRTV